MCFSFLFFIMPGAPSIIGMMVVLRFRVLDFYSQIFLFILFSLSLSLYIYIYIYIIDKFKSRSAKVVELWVLMQLLNSYQASTDTSGNIIYLAQLRLLIISQLDQSGKLIDDMYLVSFVLSGTPASTCLQYLPLVNEHPFSYWVGLSSWSGLESGLSAWLERKTGASLSRYLNFAQLLLFLFYDCIILLSQCWANSTCSVSVMSITIRWPQFFPQSGEGSKSIMDYVFKVNPGLTTLQNRQPSKRDGECLT